MRRGMTSRRALVIEGGFGACDSGAHLVFLWLRAGTVQEVVSGNA